MKRHPHSALLGLPLIAALTLLASCSEPEPSSQITGKVVDVRNGEPLAEISVRIAGSAIETVTNKAGEFCINYVPGSFELAFHKKGFAPFSTELSLLDSVAYPLETVRMLRVPKSPGLAYASETRFDELKPATLKPRPQAPLREGSWSDFGRAMNNSLYNQIVASGEALRLPAHQPTVFVDTDGFRNELYRLSPEGHLDLLKGRERNKNAVPGLMRKPIPEAGEMIGFKDGLAPGTYLFLSPRRDGDYGRDANFMQMPSYLIEVVAEGGEANGFTRLDPLAATPPPSKPESNISKTPSAHPSLVSQDKAILGAASIYLGNKEGLAHPVAIKVRSLQKDKDHAWLRAFRGETEDSLPDISFDLGLQRSHGSWEVILDFSGADVPTNDTLKIMRSKVPDTYPAELIPAFWSQHFARIGQPLGEPETASKPESNPKLEKLLLGSWVADKFIVFHRDGTYTLRKYRGDPNDDGITRQWKVVDGNRLLWITPQGTSEEEIIKLTSDELVLSKSGTFYRI